MSFELDRKRRARLKGIVASHTAALALIDEPGDVAIVKRGALRSVVMRCPDACGEVITLNLDPRTDKAWRIYRSPRGVTIFPSVWRDTGCQSHFIIWNDVISWTNAFDEDARWSDNETELEERVWRALRPDAYSEFVQIADALDEIPWAVLDACRRLVKEGRAKAGLGSMKSSFRRTA